MSFYIRKYIDVRVFNVNSDCVESNSSVDVNFDVDINESCTKFKPESDANNFKILELLNCTICCFPHLKAKTEIRGLAFSI